MGFKEKNFYIWNQVWSLHKKYFDIGSKDEDWSKFVKEVDGIGRQYEGKTEYGFIKDLLLAVVGEIERTDRRRRKEHESNE